MSEQPLQKFTEGLQHLQFQIIQQQFGIIGKSRQFLRALERAIKVAPTDLTVLLRGESGTGKEVFARLIHSLSNRKDYPLITVNCAAIPDTLLEAELFGYEKGAFTDAHERHRGFFEVADHGTIFLDEIAEMSPKIQAKLLRVLESGEFNRLGSTETIRVDVRVLSATNRPLEMAVQTGEFRQDLFYRLNTVQIYLPPLRERKEDIPLLAEYFARRIAQHLEIPFEGFTDEALQLLMRLPWYGNIRELRNVIETVMTIERPSIITPATLQPHLPKVLGAPGERSLPAAGSIQNEFALQQQLAAIQQDLQEIKELLQHNRAAPRSLPAPATDNPSLPSLNLQELEKIAIRQALEATHWNKRKAAQLLGISPRTLYRKLAAYGLE